MTIKLEYGKRYVTRNGTVTGRLVFIPDGRIFSFACPDGSVPDARWKIDGSWGIRADFPTLNDIVSEYEEPVVKPVRKIKVGDVVRLSAGQPLWNGLVTGWVTALDRGYDGEVTIQTNDCHVDTYHEDWLEVVPSGSGSDVKPSNPKDSIGVTKPPLSCVPCGPLYEIGAAMLDGSCKYGRHNYREIGVRSSVYYDAMLRHLMTWWEGEERAADSGCLHLAHLAACAIILMDCPDINDDRPPIVGNPVDRVAGLVKSILAKYPEPKSAFTEKKS